ncbi:hypothetical protein BH09ACT11_BH09ACT11_19170 [soil metagenome]
MRASAAGAALFLLLPVAGCGGGGAGSLSPQEALDQAWTTLVDTSGVSFTLTTDAIPDGTVGLLSADGVLNKSPAFEGEFSVPIGGFEPTIKVIAVDDVVYAQLPLTPGWQQIEPSDYGVPDPARLIDGETGIASFLPATTEVSEGEQTRGGVDNKDILTVYTGIVPGDSVASVISSATGDFDVDYTISDSGVLSEAVITGDFYGTGEDTTYTATISDYGSNPEITAP